MAMEPFRFHVFVCNQQKPDGMPSCYNHGSAQVIDALRREVAANGLDEEVQVTVCGSLGTCEHGPSMVVYPEGIWYTGVAPADIPEIVDSHFRKGMPVGRLCCTDGGFLRGEILRNREKTRTALRTRESSGVLPEEINARVRAFQESRAILTALELNVFTAVGDHATASEAAARMNTDVRATGMLLNALTAIGLLSKEGSAYRNSPVAARFLSTESPHCARTALLHTANLWKTWSTLTECVRAGAAVANDPTLHDDAWVDTFIAAMHRNASERSAAVVQAMGPVEGRMLDIGGGSGAYSIAFAQANPTLEVDMIDQPQVEPIARTNIRKAGLEDRIHLACGDLNTAPLGEGYDLAFLSAICHMLSADENFALLKRCFAVLAPGGRVAIHDFVLDAQKTGPKFAALFALNMLTGTSGGSTYTEPEYTTWLEAAGFQSVRQIRLAGPASLIVAVKE
jgi:(2Fe-2S) ferredoxin/ubiquinone/menaquinone biosynthesis C-methylase UbiE